MKNKLKKDVLNKRSYLIMGVGKWALILEIRFWVECITYYFIKFLKYFYEIYFIILLYRRKGRDLRKLSFFFWVIELLYI